MKIFLSLFFCISLLAFSHVSAATVEKYPLANAQEEQHFQQLLSNYRCLVCQNESLADSNADLADDLRGQIYQLLLQKKSDQQINDFLVARYGDFILYRPPLQKNTLLLWLGPLGLLFIGFIIVYSLLAKKSTLEKINKD